LEELLKTGYVICWYKRGEEKVLVEEYEKGLELFKERARIIEEKLMKEYKMERPK